MSPMSHTMERKTLDRIAARKKRIFEYFAQSVKPEVKPAERIAIRDWFVPNVRLLRATGFWPYAGDGAPRVLARLQTSYLYLIVSCNLIFFSTKAMHTILDEFSIQALTENLVDLLCIMFSLNQLLVLLAIKERVLHVMKKTEHVLHHVFTEAEEDFQRDLLEKRDSSQKSSYALFTLFLFAGSNFALIVSVTGKRKHTLPIPIWTPFPQDVSPTLEFLLFIETLGMVLTVAGAGALSAFFSSLVRAMQACFRAVRRTFQLQASSGAWTWTYEDKTNALENLKRAVHTHQIVLELSDEMCLVLGPFFTCQLVIIAFIICVGLFQISVDPTDYRNVRFMGPIVVVILQSFSICLLGTNLTEEAKSVQDGVEDGDWFLQGKDLGYTTRFIVMRAQKPPRILVAKSFSVLLPTFVEMMRTSYSLLAFLQKRAKGDT